MQFKSVCDVKSVKDSLPLLSQSWTKVAWFFASFDFMFLGGHFVTSIFSLFDVTVVVFSVMSYSTSKFSWFANIFASLKTQGKRSRENSECNSLIYVKLRKWPLTWIMKRAWKWICNVINKGLTWLFERILFNCARVVPFAARARSARATNDATREQINNIPEKSHVIIIIINKQGQMISIIRGLMIQAKWITNSKSLQIII